ncbi:hypothetical protein AL057_23530 [Pseudomonas amygdali pv. myricae]|nr:hypothetical protein AL057_23530 [Pseudomonas amygdali pv. myricae]
MMIFLNQRKAGSVTRSVYSQFDGASRTLMERCGVHMSTISVHYLGREAGLTRQNLPKSLYSMNIHEMASFLLSGL